MPPTIIASSSDCVIARHVGLDDERRLGLPHEDVGGRRERLGAAGAASGYIMPRAKICTMNCSTPK